ncbi:MAG: hypothetical protein ACM3XM_13025 [Mycobacterium leprae]
MQTVRRCLAQLGFGPQLRQSDQQTDYKRLMQEALDRIRTAELSMQEATSLEELDIARSMLLGGMAEVQQVVRQAKRDRGIALRPIAQVEEFHRNLRDFLNGRTNGTKPIGARQRARSAH